MTALSEARTVDREGRVEEAAQLYEAELSLDPEDVEARIDLAVLYWQSTDYGVWKTTGLSQVFVERAGRRFRELLDQGRSMFPSSPMFLFWTKYIAWADLGEPFDPGECRELLRTHPEYLEPSMYLYSTSEGVECEREARELLQKCRELITTRMRYVASVVESVERRVRRH